MRQFLARLALKLLREELEAEWITEDLLMPLPSMGMNEEVIEDIVDISRTEQFKTFQRMLNGHRRYTAKRSLKISPTKQKHIIRQAKLQGEALAFTKILRLFQKARRARQYLKGEK